jgi:hypothetical protein
MTKLELSHEGDTARVRAASGYISKMEIPDIDPLPLSGQKIKNREECQAWLCKRYGVDLPTLNRWNAMAAPVLDYRLMKGWLNGREDSK